MRLEGHSRRACGSTSRLLPPPLLTHQPISPPSTQKTPPPRAVVHSEPMNPRPHPLTPNPTTTNKPHTHTSNPYHPCFSPPTSLQLSTLRYIVTTHGRWPFPPPPSRWQGSRSGSQSKRSDGMEYVEREKRVGAWVAENGVAEAYDWSALQR